VKFIHYNNSLLPTVRSQNVVHSCVRTILAIYVNFCVLLSVLTSDFFFTACAELWEGFSSISKFQNVMQEAQFPK
jgi:hypothetical protein